MNKSEDILSNPKFMEWGIITKENFKDIYDLPIKRWDPLSTVMIKTKDFGLREEKIRYFGHYSYLSPIRGKRPKGFKELDIANLNEDCISDFYSDFKDVFMAVIKGKELRSKDGSLAGDGYTIIITEDRKRRDNPFIEYPHRIFKLPVSCKAITLINRYPSMARIVDQEICSYAEQQLPHHLKVARGINLVTLTKEFYPSHCLNLIPTEVIEALFLSMKEAILYCVQESIDRDYYDIPVSPFFNIGQKVGGSQPRFHGQVYIDLNQDGHGSRLEHYLEAFKEMGNDCHLCETTHGDSDRLLIKTKFWTFYTSGSPIRNYHIRFHPNEHIRRFSQLKSNQIRDFSVILKKISEALNEIGIDKNRNIFFNSCPYGYDADFHLFGDLIPHETIGGAEMAEDMRVARKLPHIAAFEIREALYRNK